MKFVKEVRKEVLDIDALKKSIRIHKAQAFSMYYRDMRLVMSSETRRELICARETMCIPTGTGKTKDVFEGCPIDINEGLKFGEVLFTLEMPV